MAELIHTFAGNPLDRGEAIRRSEEEVQALANEINSSCRFTSSTSPQTYGRQTGLDTSRQSIRRNYVHNEAHTGFSVSSTTWRTSLPSTDSSSMRGGDLCRLPVVASQLDGWRQAYSRRRAPTGHWRRRNPYCPSVEVRPGARTRPAVPTLQHLQQTLSRAQFGCDHADHRSARRAINACCGESQGRMAQTNFYSALAGFLDQGESLEEAVRREVWEEAGIRVGDVHYHSSRPWPFSSQLMSRCRGRNPGDRRPDPAAKWPSVRWFTRADAGTGGKSP